MSSASEITCWTMVKAAAAGDAEARGDFAGRYLDVVRAYLGARWRQGPLRDALDDAVQDVFLECFKPTGPLEGIDPDGPARFRSFLYSVVRNVARRHEERQLARNRREESGVSRIETDADSLATTFDKAWARAMIKQAGLRQRLQAEAGGADALRRVEILRLRFGENLPVRAIADRLEMDRDLCHAELRKARAEFQRALREEVLYHNPQGKDVDAECLKLLELLR
ncbi:MAG: sigma-70 family RNA polymerase sigma factor [Planctomycetes bacterium]|nr:sigma-70 family RNA polymerase sigma factor [Planctomycetota bacterium]